MECNLKMKKKNCGKIKKKSLVIHIRIWRMILGIQILEMKPIVLFQNDVLH
jgi:hypothetical protein